MLLKVRKSVLRDQQEGKVRLDYKNPNNLVVGLHHPPELHLLFQKPLFGILQRTVDRLYKRKQEFEKILSQVKSKFSKK